MLTQSAPLVESRLSILNLLHRPSADMQRTCRISRFGTDSEMAGVERLRGLATHFRPVQVPKAVFTSAEAAAQPEGKQGEVIARTGPNNAPTALLCRSHVTHRCVD
jgi:hypothetical protein